MKIQYRSLDQVVVTMDQCELSILRDGLLQFIPYVRINNYFDDNQIGMIKEMAEQLTKSLEAINGK
jgi:hypothetical protein